MRSSGDLQSGTPVAMLLYTQAAAPPSPDGAAGDMGLAGYQTVISAAQMP